MGRMTNIRQRLPHKLTALVRAETKISTKKILCFILNVLRPINSFIT